MGLNKEQSSHLLGLTVMQTLCFVLTMLYSWHVWRTVPNKYARLDYLPLLLLGYGVSLLLTVIVILYAGVLLICHRDPKPAIYMVLVLPLPLLALFIWLMNRVPHHHY